MSMEPIQCPYPFCAAPIKRVLVGSRLSYGFMGALASTSLFNSFAANVAVMRPTAERQCRHNATWTCGLFQ